MVLLFIFMELFFQSIPHSTVHQSKFQWLFQIMLRLSVIITQNRNRCICSIINERPTIFWLVQKFDVTVINKCRFGLNLIVFILDWTCTYIHSIVNFVKDTAGTPFFYSCVQYRCHSHKISNTRVTFYLIRVCVIHSSRC